jgi:hypothetical protein
LRAWIDENRDKLRTREFLRANRAEWLKHGRDPGLLGLPSLYVEAARSLYEQPGDVVIDDIVDYVEALLAHERRRREDERDALEAKQRKDLVFANERAEAAQRLVEERTKTEARERQLRQQAETEAKKAKRRLWLMALGALIFVSGSFWALSERARRAAAEELKAQAIQGESAVLAALSDAKRPANPALATKLALAAWPRGAGDERPKLRVAVSALSDAVSDLRERRVFRGHVDLVATAAFSPNGALVVTASDDKTARVWDVATGQAIAVLGGHDDPVLSAAFSPDGARVVTASYGKTARVWDAATGKAIAVLSGHDGGVLSAAFSPDGARVVTASADKTARVWNAATGKAIAVLTGHDDEVRSAAFSPDGGRVVTASRDWTARV